MKNVYVDLSQDMSCTQTCATTQFEQTLMVPIEAPPYYDFVPIITYLSRHNHGNDENDGVIRRDGGWVVTIP